MKFSSHLGIKFLVFLFYSVAIHQSIHGALNYLEDDDKYGINFIINFTKHLNNKHRFNGFICFGEYHKPDQASHLIVRTLEQILVAEFDLPIIVWGKERNVKLREDIGFNNLAFINIARIDDAILEVVDYTLEGRHHMPMVFVYQALGNVPPTEHQIHEFFNWCWSKNIFNVALTFEADTVNQVYKYSPFPVITVFNLTSLAYTSNGDFIDDKISNTHGYQFITPAFSDPTLVILVPPELHHPDESKYAISGNAGRFYTEFIEYINGTIKLIPKHYPTLFAFYHYYQPEIIQGHYDIGIHPFYELSNIANWIEGSYPIGWSNACIIVPEANEIKKSDYLALASIISMRYLLVGLLLSLALLQVLCNKPIYISLRRIGQAIWNSFGMVVIQALPLTQLQNRRSRFAFFYVMSVLVSLILASIYTASLTSLFSKIVLDKQIKTVEDFLQSDLKIMVDSDERRLFFETNYLPSDLMSRLYVTDSEAMTKHRDALNTSYAYVAIDQRWTMIHMKQQGLSIPRFRIAGRELCTPQFFRKFPMQWDSPFINSLTLFFMYAQESGLPIKWEKETKHKIIEMKLIDVIEDKYPSKHPEPISISHIENVLWICVLMWVCSILCFFGELIWYWWSVKRNRRPNSKQQLAEI